MDYVNAAVSVLSGIAVCIPLVIKLVLTVKQYVKEKNWCSLVALAARYMVEAEGLYKDGAEKKQWVMTMLESSAKSINYDLSPENIVKLSEMIEELCKMSKGVNVTTVVAEISE